MRLRTARHNAQRAGTKSRNPRRGYCLTLCRGPRTLPVMAQPDTTVQARPWLWWGMAIAAILLGFADLARGGTSVAPILLVLGYCVLVPIAILK